MQLRCCPLCWLSTVQKRKCCSTTASGSRCGFRWPRTGVTMARRVLLTKRLQLSRPVSFVQVNSSRSPIISCCAGNIISCCHSLTKQLYMLTQNNSSNNSFAFVGISIAQQQQQNSSRGTPCLQQQQGLAASAGYNSMCLSERRACTIY